MKTILLSTVSAHAANLTGTWKGTGRAVDNQGKPTDCESVTLTFTQTATSFAVSSSFTCGGLPFTIPGGAMEIRGGELFDQGVKSGTITDTSVSLVAHAKGYVMKSSATFTDTAMNLSSVISVGTNPAPALTFQATLRR
jgi:hypothetical protein